MFTGIVERVGRVAAPGRKLVVETGWADLRRGESIAVSGVCLTVARLDGGRAGFDIVPETVRRTTLGDFKKGGRVNLERALRAGDRLSGHLVQGHIDGTGRVIRAGATLRIESPLAAQLVPKGSVAIDGVSLTVVDVEPGAFTIALIPTTRKITTLGRLRKGQRVNVELDVMLKKSGPPSRVTVDLLRRAGFI
jgi:riboflavin synthase alpha subunit